MNQRRKSIQKTIRQAQIHNKRVTTVRQLKRKYNDLPLSFLYGIPQELEFQCPMIDEYIEKIESCRESLKKAKRARTLETKNSHVLKAIYSLENMDTNLDEITRNNFESLREYAKQWKLFAIRLLDFTKSPEKFLSK